MSLTIVSALVGAGKIAVGVPAEWWLLSLCCLQTEAFTNEGIDQILTNRTEKRQIGSRAGNSFSVATFGVGGSEQVISSLC